MSVGLLIHPDLVKEEKRLPGHDVLRPMNESKSLSQTIDA